MSTFRDENNILRPNTIVKHFKREMLTDDENAMCNDYLYMVIGIALHTETKEKFVVYKALYGDQNMYARPKDMFLSEVDREKYPNIKQEYRLEKLTKDDIIPEGFKFGYFV